MIHVALVGSTGLVGESLIRVLLGHPGVRLAFLGSEHAAGQPIDKVLPSLRNSIGLTCQQTTVERLIECADATILAGKSPEAMAFVPPLLQAGRKVIDIGGEFRLQSATLYEQWYPEKHLCPEMLPRAVYGLPEMNRNRIRSADLVANPGCYATAAILGLMPLLEAGALTQAPIPVDAFSGLSGAGRTATGSNLFVQCNENVRGYKLGQHRHTPEIEEALARAAGRPQRVIFLPHVVPLDRGIYCTSFVETLRPMSTGDVLALLRARYEHEPFVRIVDDAAQIDLLSVRDTNFCDLSALADPSSTRVMVFSALDNMVKGAAGQAVQNLNLMFGLEERLGLVNRRMI